MEHEKIWTKYDSETDAKYVVSARRDWINEKFVRDALASEDVYWGVAMSSEATKIMLDNSMTLCLYKQEAGHDERSLGNLAQIGMARAITDQVTFLYLTDVFVLPEYQGKGLGNFIIECLKDSVDSMRGHGAFRRLALMTGRGSRTAAFYTRVLDMEARDDIPDLVFLTTKYRVL